jgi:hypothetical protein
MSLIGLIITLVVVGVILWLVNSYIPMDATIKKILNIVVVIAVVLWLLNAFGLLTGLGDYRIGR